MPSCFTQRAAFQPAVLSRRLLWRSGWRLSLLLAIVSRRQPPKPPDWLRLPVLVPWRRPRSSSWDSLSADGRTRRGGGTLIRGEQRYVLYNAATRRPALPSGSPCPTAAYFEQVTVAIDTIVQEMDAGALGTVSVSLSAGQTDEIAVGLSGRAARRYADSPGPGIPRTLHPGVRSRPRAWLYVTRTGSPMRLCWTRALPAMGSRAARSSGI